MRNDQPKDDRDTWLSTGEHGGATFLDSGVRIDNDRVLTGMKKFTLDTCQLTEQVVLVHQSLCDAFPNHFLEYNSFAIDEITEKRGLTTDQYDNPRFNRSFNGKFFMKNFAKNLIVRQLALLLLNQTEFDIADIGSGAGSASLAWSLFRKHRRGQIFLYDRSELQLQISRKVIGHFGIRNLEFDLKDVQDLLDIKADLYLMSYWLCEQDIKLAAETIISKRRNDPRGAFLIVDYRDTLEYFQQLTQGAIRPTIASLKIPVSSPLARAISDAFLNINICLVQ